MEFKYLAIKNWDKYQPNNKKCLPWIRDYKEKDFDPAMASLTMLQRYVLDGLCRLRGRFDKNVCNDAVWVSRALCVLPVERRFVGQAISVLVLKGFLVLTNQEVNSLVEVSKEEKREEEEQKDASPSADVKAKFQLPGWIEKQTWEDYEQMRRRIGKPMTDRARNLAVDKLAALQNKGHPVVDVLKQSIFNSWQGLFELKGSSNGKQSKLERTLQNFAELEAEERSQVPGAGHGATVSGPATTEGKHTGHH